MVKTALNKLSQKLLEAKGWESSMREAETLLGT